MRCCMQALVCLFLAALFIAGGPARSQADPTLDVAVVGCEPGFSANNWRIVTTISLLSIEPQADHELTVHLFLDGAFLYEFTSVVSYDPEPTDCYDALYSLCQGEGCPNLDAFLYEDVPGECGAEGFGNCGCSWLLDLHSPWMLIGEHETLTVVVDPENAIEEMDEENNVLVVDLTPVPTSQRAWSTIKAIYR